MVRILALTNETPTNMHEAFQAPLSCFIRNIIGLISADDSEVRHDGTLESLLAEAWRLIMWGRFCSPNRVRLKQKCNQAYSFSNVAVRSLLLDLHALKQHS
jgi:hypothetical protein